MRAPLAVLGAVVFLIACGPAYADDVVNATRVISGEEIELADGRVVRLDGIKAVAPEARAFLEKEALGRPLILAEATTDRYGRTKALLSVKGKNASLQEEELLEGLAFVYPEDDGDDEPLFSAEREARRNKRGIWKEPFDKTSSEASENIGRYAIVEGVVSKAERIKNKIYLSFGNSERPDFTLVMAAKFLRPLRKRGLEPLESAGKTLRARGWITQDSGARMTLSNLNQLEWE